MTGVALAGRRLSVAVTTELAARLATHLSRSDGQEDLCFRDRGGGDLARRR